MATAKQEESARQGIEQFLPLGILKDAANLVHRLREGEAFPRYVRKRVRLVVPMGALFLSTSIASAAATVVFLAGTSSLILLPALLLMPFVLLGSLFVQGYVFFSWLENRALARVYGKRARPAQGPVAVWLRKTLRADLGQWPPVPWLLAALCLFLPLAMLLSVATKAAFVLLALHGLAPILYARLDR
jgi:hypothetical protein